MKAILRSINNFSCKLKQSNNLKYNISPKIRSNKFKSISGNGNVTIEDALNKDLKDYKVYGNTYQNSTTGKNLFDKNAVSIGYLNEIGVLYNDISYETSDFILIQPNTSYYKTLTLSPRTKYYDKNKQPLNTTTYQDVSIGGAAGTFTTPDNAYYLRFSYPFNGVDKEQIQLEEGTTFTNYEPYTGGQPSPNPDYPQEIISFGDRTKNLFDKNNANIINGYIEAKTGKIISNNIDSIAYIICKPHTKYSFQRMQIRDNKGRFRIGTTQTIPVADMTVENLYYDYSSEYSTTKLDGYVTNADAKYLLFYFSQISYMSQNEIDTILGSIQIEENPIATEYESYYDGYKIPVNVNNVITNIYLEEPLRKIGKYSDYIDFANGKVVRNIDEIALDGTENWKGVQDYQSSTTMASKNGTFSVIRRMNKINNLISNKFNVQKNDNVSDNKTAQSNLKNAHFCIIKNNPDRIYFKWENWQGKTGNEVKEIVALEPITINYTLETPTEEDIELPNIKLIEGKNIITIGTEVQGVFESEYYSKEIIDISNYKYNLRKVED